MPVSDLYVDILARTAKVCRANTTLPMLATREVQISPEFKSRGATVTIPIIDLPPEPQDIVPAAVPPVRPAPASRKVELSLDYWKDTTFVLTDEEMAKMANSADYIPKQLQSHGAGLAEEVNSTGMQLYKGVYGFAGTPGVTPFGVSTLEAQDAGRVLSQQRCPKVMGERHFLVDPFAYHNALGLKVVQEVDAAGTPLALREGVIPRMLGSWWWEDQQMPVHENPNGTPTGWLVNGAVTAAPRDFTDTVAIDTGSNDPVQGDIFTVAGDSQTYVVNSYAAGTITFSPGAQENWADNAAITFKGSHVVNLHFDSNAFVFASRLAADYVPKGIANITHWVDDVSGLALSLEVQRQSHQTAFILSCLWGWQLVQPRFATRVAG